MKGKQISKEAIIRAYRDLVERNSGKLIGCEVFSRETGISQFYWRGGYWRSWSAFQEELGYTPNVRTPRIDDEVLLRCFAELALELGHLPTQADLQLKHHQDTSFPDKGVFRRWGGRDVLLAALAEYCDDKPLFEPVSALLKEGASASLEHRLESYRITGFVYLLRSGKDYKIGCTNATGRRLRELAIQLPQKPNTVHVIETDDPKGIEQYWHRRFADRRQGGEWFTLSADDVRAFKKRRFQ